MASIHSQYRLPSRTLGITLFLALPLRLNSAKNLLFVKRGVFGRAPCSSVWLSPIMYMPLVIVFLPSSKSFGRVSGCLLPSYQYIVTASRLSVFGNVHLTVDELGINTFWSNEQSDSSSSTVQSPLRSSAHTGASPVWQNQSPSMPVP